MNADAFRHLYEYHFTENRRIWDAHIASLPYEQFIQDMGYSHGSVRDQMAHIMSADEAWFSELRGVDFPEPYEPANSDDREILRARWDALEKTQREYLAALRDDMLFKKPFPAGEDENLIVWQVLIHVVNHGTDHRAQLLRFLNDLGLKTSSQDYIFFVYDHP